MFDFLVSMDESGNFVPRLAGSQRNAGTKMVMKLRGDVVAVAERHLMKR